MFKYTRPSDLGWHGVVISKHVFGERVVEKVTEIVSEGHKLTGVVARPVYVCTGQVAGGLCMTTGSMSRMFDKETTRTKFFCSSCKKLMEAPVSDRIQLR